MIIIPYAARTCFPGLRTRTGAARTPACRRHNKYPMKRPSLLRGIVLIVTSILLIIVLRCQHTYVSLASVSLGTLLSNDRDAFTADHVGPLGDFSFYPKTDLSQGDVEGIQYFVLFIGYPHSGHSIIGSMMDAHPNMIIAHQYYLLSRWNAEKRDLLGNKTALFNRLYHNSVLSSGRGGRLVDVHKKGYNLNLPDLWQGRFTDLKVIGDKSGGRFSTLVAQRRSIREVLDEIRWTVGVPIKLIHIVRNYFDIIATAVLKPNTVGAHRWNHSNNSTSAISSEDHATRLLAAFDRIRKLAEAVVKVKRNWDLDMIELHYADFVHDPKGTLRNICDFLHVECPTEYLEACEEKTFEETSKSRYLINWSTQHIEMMQTIMNKMNFFRRYSFDGD